MLNFTLKPTVAVLTCTLALGLATVSTAQAAVFKWSFTNVIGGVPGTASGVLRVPSGNDVAATSVILTQTTNPVFAGLVGTDFALLPNFRNQFNVGGGSVTAALFGSSNSKFRTILRRFSDHWDYQEL